MTHRARRDTSNDAPSVHSDLLLAAQEAVRFASSGYGPSGGHKLIHDESSVLVDSPASALREVHIGHPLVRPFKQLATQVQATVGDGATTAVLLAARMVASGLEARVNGVPLPATIAGLELARRQTLAVLDAMARDDPEGRCLGPEGVAVLDGLKQLADAAGRVDLDVVDVRCESGGELGWFEGLVLEPSREPASALRAAGVLLIRSGPRTTSTSMTIRSPGAIAGLHQAQAQDLHRVVETIAALGVDLLVCTKKLDETLSDALHAAGVMVCNDASTDMIRRLEQATGATLVENSGCATLADVGTADVTSRPARRGGWVLTGPGPSATFCVAAQHPTMAAAAIDRAERMLRVAGPFLTDGRAVPGDGAWQQAVAQSLRKAASAAPGKSAFGVRQAAEAFGALVDDLTRSEGKDPLNGRCPDESVLDAFHAVRHAVVSAFEVACAMLRLDGMYAKQESTQEALRGGNGKIGSPKGMPGDVPPLM